MGVVRERERERERGRGMGVTTDAPHDLIDISRLSTFVGFI